MRKLYALLLLSVFVFVVSSPHISFANDLPHRGICFVKVEKNHIDCDFIQSNELHLGYSSNLIIAFIAPAVVNKGSFVAYTKPTIRPPNLLQFR